MNGAGLTPGSVAGSGASGGDRIMGAEAGVHHGAALSPLPFLFVSCLFPYYTTFSTNF